MSALAGIGWHSGDFIVKTAKLLYKSFTTSTINMSRYAFSGKPEMVDAFNKAGGWAVYGTGLALKSFIGLGLAAGTMESITKERDMIGGGKYQTVPTHLFEWETRLAAGGAALAVIPSLLKLSGLKSKTPWAMRGPLTFNYILAGIGLAGAKFCSSRIKSLAEPSGGGLDAAGPLFMNTDPNSSYAYMSRWLEGSAAERAWHDQVHGKPGEKIRGFLDSVIQRVGNTIFGEQDAYTHGVNHIA